MSYSNLTISGDRPDVKTVKPAFNAARTIIRAIDSVVIQTCADRHLICFRGASTSPRLEIFQSDASRLGGRIAILEGTANDGPVLARNRGLTGAWIAVLNADDAWKSGCLKDLLRRRHGTSTHTSMRLMQHGDLGVPIVGPDIVPGGPRRSRYGRRLASLLTNKIWRASSCIDLTLTRHAPSWAQVVERVLHAKSYAESRL